MRIVWFQIGKALARAFFVLSGACIASVALAAAFPERPINIIVPFAAGGGTDVTARLFGRGIEKHLAGARVYEERDGLRLGWQTGLVRLKRDLAKRASGRWRGKSTT